MKKILTASIIALSGFLFSQDKITEIKIATPEWDLYSQKDGQGLYHELWENIFKAQGIKVSVTYLPFKRCLLELKEKRVDAAAGVYSDPDLITPKWHLGIDLISVAYNCSAPKWSNQSDFLNKRVSWMRGYGLDEKKIVSVGVEKHEFDKLEYCLSMLEIGRVDYVLDYSDAIKTAIEKQQLKKILVVPNAIKGPKYYFAFCKTPKGQQLAELWDKGMEKLEKSGKLKLMYKKLSDQSY